MRTVHVDLSGDSDAERAETTASISYLSKPVQGFLLELISHWHNQFLSHPEAKKDLQHWGLNKRTIWKQLKIGYSKGDVSHRVSAAQRDILRSLHLLSSDGDDRTSGSILLPLRHLDSTIGGMLLIKDFDELNVDLLLFDEKIPVMLGEKALQVYRDLLILSSSFAEYLALLQAGLQNVIYTPLESSLHLAQICHDERIEHLILLSTKGDEHQHLKQDGFADSLINSRTTLTGITVPGDKQVFKQLLSGSLNKDELSSLITRQISLTGGNIHSPDTNSKKGEVRKLNFEDKGNRKHFYFDSRSYRALGVKEIFTTNLRISLKLETVFGMYLDNVDLYSAKSRSSYARGASDNCHIEKHVIDRDLLEIIAVLEERRDVVLDGEQGSQLIDLTDEERAQAEHYLSQSNLAEAIIADTSELGLVGEEENRLLLYIAATSRKLPSPISCIVSSDSSSGKSFLIDSIGSLIPPEDCVSFTSLSDLSLQYLPDDGLIEKFLIMGEAVYSPAVEHQIREMLSAGELKRLVTVSDKGQTVSRMVIKKVRVAAVMSSTHDINRENASRFFVLRTDESESQTRAIHHKQRKWYAIEQALPSTRNPADIRHAHHCIQRILKGYRVVNPYSELLTFPSKRMRSRRDQKRFLDLIAAVCFLRQYQKTPYELPDGTMAIDCDIDDYRIAHRLMMHILSSTETDLPLHCEQVYEKLRSLAHDKADSLSCSVLDVQVTQRQVREYSLFSHDIVKRCLRELVAREFLRLHSTRSVGHTYHYSIVADEELSEMNTSVLLTPDKLFDLIQTRKVGQTGAEVGQELESAISPYGERT